MKAFLTIAMAAPLLIPSLAIARDISVDKELVCVSPPDSQGIATVSGVAGTARSIGGASVFVENRETKQIQHGRISEHGSFKVRIRAKPGDRLRLNFVSDSGGTKKISRKVKEPEDVSINRGLISVSPPDKRGLITVSGKGDAVQSAGSVRMIVENVKSNEKVEGEVKKDGSFEVLMTAFIEDKIRVEFVSSSGDKEKANYRVPAAAKRHPEMTLPVAKFQHNKKNYEKPTPEIIIHYREDSSSKGKPVTADYELDQSGILPPE